MSYVRLLLVLCMKAFLLDRLAKALTTTVVGRLRLFNLIPTFPVLVVLMLLMLRCGKPVGACAPVLTCPDLERLSRKCWIPVKLVGRLLCLVIAYLVLLWDRSIRIRLLFVARWTELMVPTDLLRFVISGLLGLRALAGVLWWVI